MVRLPQEECHSESFLEVENNIAPAERWTAECSSPKTMFRDVKLASLNLCGGITDTSGRQKIVHLMKENKIDILALQETRVNTDSMEIHDGFTFYFSTSVTDEVRTEAEKTRQHQNNLATKSMTEIELFNLDAEKHEVALVYSGKLCRCKQNIKQINGRLIVVSFDTARVRTNVIAAYAPHAGRSMKDKDSFYQDLQAPVNSLPKHEINIIRGDFKARLAERPSHEHYIVGLRGDNRIAALTS